MQLKQLRPLILRRFTAFSPHFAGLFPRPSCCFTGHAAYSPPILPAFVATDMLLLPARNKQILPGLP
jgi:hypothetical protein